MILYIDIETIPLIYQYDRLKPIDKMFWEKKSVYYQRDGLSLEESYMQKAGIYAEFSRVLCIGLGYVNIPSKEFRTTVLYHADESILLEQFKQHIEPFRKYGEVSFCGHNIKEFDLPFLCRRMRINNISLPDELNLMGKKPWENQNIDTMDLWRFGEHKRFTSLDLLAHTLGVESSKTDLSGDQIAKAYYEEHRLDDIMNYCKRDVLCTAQVYYRLIGVEWPFIK